MTKGHDAVGEGPPRRCEGGFVPILPSDLNLVVAGESIHEGEYLMACASVNDLVDERGGVVVFGTCFVQVLEIRAYADGPLFLV